MLLDRNLQERWEVRAIYSLSDWGDRDKVKFHFVLFRYFDGAKSDLVQMTQIPHNSLPLETDIHSQNLQYPAEIFGSNI